MKRFNEMSRALVCFSLLMLCRADELDEEVEDQGLMKIIRALTNQTKADNLNLPSNATSIRENITDTFSCENRTYGYYADVDNDCQVFHVCLPSRTTSGQNRTYRWSFICPEETVFNQEVMVCTREADSINCTDSPQYYDMNMEFGKTNDTEDYMGNDNNYDNDKPIENIVKNEQIDKDDKPVAETPKRIKTTRRNKPKRVSQQQVKNEKLLAAKAERNEIRKELRLQSEIESKTTKMESEINEVTENNKMQTKVAGNNNQNRRMKDTERMQTEIDENTNDPVDIYPDIIMTESNSKIYNQNNYETPQVEMIEIVKELEPKEQKDEYPKEMNARREVRKMRKLRRGSLKFKADVK